MIFLNSTQVESKTFIKIFCITLEQRIDAHLIFFAFK